MAEQRTARGLRDLVLSLSVVGLGVLFLFVVVWRPAPDPVRPIDLAPMLALAREEAAYPVLAADGLSPQWRATSARFEPTADGSIWFLGYVTPEDQFVAVTQTDGDPVRFVEEQTLGGAPDGKRSIDGRRWEQFATADQRSLVRTSDGATTVVTGTVSYEELADFVGRLSS